MMANLPADPVARVRAFLETHGAEFRIFHTDETIFTVEDASRTIGVPSEKILKSLLFFINDREWALALMSGSNRVSDKKVKRVLGASKIRMGSADAIKTFSSFEPGGIPPVGYPEQPKTLLDEDLFLFDTIWAAAGSDHDFFPISPVDLLQMTGGAKADIKK
jgi:prolyl-tRNA editing enzyme YbaK/EbsC (Cys-tRNA(Pro) deacylase)